MAKLKNEKGHTVPLVPVKLTCAFCGRVATVDPFDPSLDWNKGFRSVGPSDAGFDPEFGAQGYWLCGDEKGVTVGPDFDD